MKWLLLCSSFHCKHKLNEFTSVTHFCKVQFKVSEASNFHEGPAADVQMDWQQCSQTQSGLDCRFGCTTLVTFLTKDLLTETPLTVCRHEQVDLKNMRGGMYFVSQLLTDVCKSSSIWFKPATSSAAADKPTQLRIKTSQTYRFNTPVGCWNSGVLFSTYYLFCILFKIL